MAARFSSTLATQLQRSARSGAVRGTVTSVSSFSTARASPLLSASLKQARTVTVNQIIVRNFGITDVLTNFATNRVEQSKEAQFTRMIESMTSTPKWTLKTWKQTIEEQLSSWVRFVPGVSSSTEMTQIKKFKAILDSMKEDELEHPETINGPARERISVISKQPIEDVVKMISFYKQTLIIHTWLQVKKQSGEVLPANEVELMEMQEMDPRLPPIVKKISGKTRRTGRGKGMPF